MPTFITRSSSIVLPSEFITDYLPSAPEGYVKLYLFALYLSQQTDAAPMDIKEALGMNDTAIAEAFAYWQAKGLVRIHSGDDLIIEFLPVRAYIEAAPVRKYASLVSALGSIMGTRILTGRELEQIFDWIDVFHMEEGAALVIVAHCVKTYGARVALWRMNAAAKRFCERGVITASEAEAEANRESVLYSGAAALTRRWKRTAPVTDDELALYDKWVNTWLFTPEVILQACAEMTSAYQPSFKYLDKILDSFRIQGVLNTDALAQLRKNRDELAEHGRIIFERAGIKSAPTAAQLEEIDFWLNRWLLPLELVLFAADSSAKDAKPFVSIRKQAELWHENKITSIPDARKLSEQTIPSKKTVYAPKRPKRLNHPEREYSDDELNKIGINLLE